MERWIRRAWINVRTYVNACRLLGSRALTLFARGWLGRRDALAVQVDGQTVWVRPRTTDLATLLQIFWNREYEFDLGADPAVVVDAGANVGYSAVYFAARYPNARIVAVEPHPENFAQLKKHAADHPRISPVQAALWHENTSLGLWDPEEGHWGFRVVPDAADAGGLEIKGVSVDALMQEFDLSRIGLLKMDVEGSEVEIFQHAAPWIGAVDTLIAELHDKYRTGCARAFYAATLDFPYEQRFGENILMSRTPLANSPAPGTSAP